jgi:hypothetical protein
MLDIGTHDALGERGCLQLDSYILKVAKEDCPKGRNNDLGGRTPSFSHPELCNNRGNNVGANGCVWPVLVLARLQSTQLCSNQQVVAMSLVISFNIPKEGI